MRVLDAAAAAHAPPFAPLIAALRERFAAGCEVPPRHVHPIRGDGGRRLTSLLMPARAKSGALRHEHMRGTLEMLARGQADGRRSNGERTIFRPVGTALEGLAAAELAVGGA